MFSAGLARQAPRIALFFSLVAAAIGTVASASSAANAVWLARSTPIRIMPLGDSITAGVGDRGIDIGTGGYRSILERLLEREGYRYTMIGRRSDFSKHVDQPAHEGWPGYVLRSFPSDPTPQLYGDVTEDALGANDPDVILLMAGTNDLLRLAHRYDGYTLPNILESMDEELAQIFKLRPHVIVIVAGVVDSPRVVACDVDRFDGAGTCAPAGGPSLRTLVDRYAARGFRAIYAPGMATAVPRDEAHFPDGIHPSGTGGYEALARVWLQAIQSVTEGGARQPVARR